MKAGWTNATLSEVCSFINRGISPKYVDAGGVAVINQKCVRNHDLSPDQARRHDLAAKSVSQDRFLRVGDVVVNSTGTGTLGRVAQVREELEEPTTVDSHVTIVRPKEGQFVTEFFGYAMIAIEAQIQMAGEGCGGQTELARSKLANEFKITFPKSHAEQKRIVAILDQAFEAIDTAKGNAEKNGRDAKELFESYLSGVFTKCSAESESVVLSSCVEFRNGLNFTKSSKGQKVKIVGVGDFRDVFLVPLEDLQEVSLDGQLNDNDKLRDGDLLVVRSNGNVELIGRTIVAKGVGRQVISHSGFTIRIRQSEQRFDPSYLCYFLRSSSTKKKLIEGGTGTNIKSLNQGMLSALRVPCPKISLQSEIVSAIERVRADVQRLGDIYHKRIDAIGALTASTLNAAFTGFL